MTEAKRTKRSGISKRRLFQAAGSAAAALTLAKGGQAAEKAAKPFDAIIVGAGNSGLPAAIFTAQRGGRVLLVEAGSQVGGTLFLSSGQMSAAGTKLQKSKGIEDSPQSHYDDIMRISRNTADPTLVHLATFNAAATFDWLTDNGLVVGADHPVTGTTHEPYSHARYAWATGEAGGSAPRGGLAILAVLNAQLKPHLDAGRVTLLTNTEVTDLIQGAKGEVTGVVAKTDKGEQKYMGRNVVLTCGGYTFNPAMFKEMEHVPEFSQATYPFSLGAGLKLGVKAGGYVRGGENHTPLFGAILTDNNFPSPMRALSRHFPGDRPPWEIFVNYAGQRFICEDMPSHNEYEQKLAKQPNERCWIVFDQEIYDKAPKKPSLVQGGFAGPWSDQDTHDAFNNGTANFFKANSIDELAGKAGIDKKGLAETIAAYNTAQASGKDPQLGRKFMPLPIKKGPFYAIQLASWALTAYAGIAVDDRLRVVRQDKTVIPNLYAAGELLGMGQLMGKSVCGGMSVTPALTFGRLLGAQILPLQA